MKIELSHVAVLVRSAARAAEKLKALGIFTGQEETYENGRVKEIYAGSYETNSALALLVEPVSRQAYTRAFKKRGYGLHHIAVNVPELDAYIDGLYDSGWLLHPWSAEALRSAGTAYLCRPGVGFVIEAQRQACDGKPRLVEKLAMPLSGRTAAMIAAAGLADAVTPAAEAGLVFAGAGTVKIGELAGNVA